jgi:hypothetical protein
MTQEDVIQKEKFAQLSEECMVPTRKTCEVKQLQPTIISICLKAQGYAIASTMIWT